ncbi:TatD family hydrolase [Pontivivens insulae]|uniref:Putative metal-dependent hydrolase YcfH n=1 Tax=Pontivivens insulae TaxID=1639689 RepID=A0A2R8AFC6_9RHOB|nr:TatD family hydrolase [Pontivivens insulae]RED12166.1 TatD DNase family protein [Pontivivens insulae]SPF30922.1 putative metal-dependent hydrolase YcfH [Pontivivens insulae]
MPRLTDSHCHLDFPDFDETRDQVVADAVAAGVERMVTICTKRAGLANVETISATYPAVWHAFGIHPMRVAEEPIITVEELVNAAQNPRMVGIGETGLDYHYTEESKADQQVSLRLHIEACRKTGLPLIIHSRDADEDMAAILTEEHAKGAFNCVMHCFSSSRALAETALGLGFYLSMSGIVTFRKSQELRDIFADAPLDRILVETDSPYLAPTPHRGKRNEPAFTAHTAAMGAEIFGVEPDTFAAATEANFERLFPRVKG